VARRKKGIEKEMLGAAVILGVLALIGTAVSNAIQSVGAGVVVIRIVD
jgi:hypothetical protein